MPHAAITVALALAVGIAVQCVARSIRVPGIILLLASGVLLGPEGLGWVRPADLGDGLYLLLDFAIAIILFEGGLNLKGERLGREQQVIRRLISEGAFVTLVGGTLAARLWLGWPWTPALLFGSLVVVTGPTVVSPLVRRLRLRPRLQTILEAEGVLIDPIGALLVALVLQVTLAGVAPRLVDGLAAILVPLLAGLFCGLAGGFLIGAALHAPSLVHGLENPLTLAFVVLTFQVSDLISPPSGLLAVTIAGMVVGHLKTPADDDLREFKDQLTVLMIGAVFTLLAADVALADVLALGWPGVGVLATLILLVRPAAVGWSSRKSGLSLGERTFLAAIAPRGIIAAAVASLTAVALRAGGAHEGAELRALVFLVIAGTVATAGVTALPLAALLRLRLPARDRIAILGAQGLGLALARELQAAGQSIILLDADPQRCRAAESAGLPVIFGDALNERTMRRIPIELVGTAIGATFNDYLNSQFARLARQSFGVEQCLVSVDSLSGSTAPEHVSRYGGDVLFDGAHDQERWDVRWRQNEVDIVPARWVGAPAEGAEAPRVSSASGPDHYAILTLTRSGRIRPMSLSLVPGGGDQAAVAVFRRERESALAALAKKGWAVSEAPPATAPATRE